jgi:hypothetical protein
VSKKRPAIFMRRTRRGLEPVSSIDEEALERFAFGADVEVDVKQRRSPPHHRWFFAVLGKIVDSGAVPFPDVDAFLDALKMACGFVEIRRRLDGAYFTVPRSISFAAADEPEFCAFKARAFDAIAERYGIDPETVLPPRPAHARAEAA